MKRQHQLLAGLFAVVSLGSSSSVLAAPYTWYWDANWPEPHAKHASPKAACDDYLSYIRGMGDPTKGRTDFDGLVYSPENGLVRYDCRTKGYWWDWTVGQFIFMGRGGRAIFREGDECPSGTSLNPASKTCQDDSVSQVEKQQGNPDNPQICNSTAASNTPTKLVSDPINFAIGNTFQEETDFAPTGASPLSFARYYNSVSGLWSHTYSAHLEMDGSAVTVVRADGSQAPFVVANNVGVPKGEELGSLVRSGSNWLYKSAANQSQTFNSAGRLMAITNPNGNTQTLTYGPSSSVTPVTVTDNLGNTLAFSHDGQLRPVELHAAGLDITYAYNSAGQFYRLNSVRNGQTESRTYHYEAAGKPNLLTGITDERGVRSVTWAYDDQGRAISSEMANGIGKIYISYGTDGSSTVTNELGKKTLYRYQVIRGVKYIVSVVGEPSANCPASNSTFTYNDRGQVLTKTDAKGFVTTHTYNDRGLETTRIEASGTPQARTTTTTWHATFNLPLTITEGGQVKTYIYDAQGRKLSTSRSAL